MDNKEKIILAKITLVIIGMLLTTLVLPFAVYKIYGKFTFDIYKAMEYDIEQEGNKLQCEWGKEKGGYGANSGYWRCSTPPCKTYNTHGKNCVREGYTGKGFLGMTDFNTNYYVCEGFGRIAISCVDYYDSREEFENSFR